jgi:hypothetical protein
MIFVAQAIPMYEAQDWVATISKLGPLWGGLVVVGCSWQRFNTPPPNRASTTARNFLLGASSYCSIILGVYVLLVCSPRLREVADAIAPKELINAVNQSVASSETSKGDGSLLGEGSTAQPINSSSFYRLLLPHYCRLKCNRRCQRN